MAAPRPRRALAPEHDAPDQAPAPLARPARRAADTPTVSYTSDARARFVRVGVPTLVTAIALSGVAYAAWPQSEDLTAVPVVAQQPSAAADDAARAEQADRADRDTARPALTPSPSSTAATEKKATQQQSAQQKDSEAAPDLTVIGTRYATTALNLRTTASKDADVIRTLATGTKLSVTETVTKGFRLVKADGKARWVSNEYLSKDKPKESDAISGAACSGGSSVESGLTADGIRVHRAVCAKFPQVTSYGGRRSGDGGFHGSGRAVDCMISDSSVGWEIARWVRANAKRLGVSEVIYSQKIWTVQRSSEGWRGMSDRGSRTANHYDHVHVSVYGNSGTA